MGGFGFGYRLTRRQVMKAVGAAIVGTVFPGAAWAGTAGSGFGAAPIDPVRATAKPVCRLLVPDFQWFTDEILVGVWAGALHNDSLMDNMGLDRVICHYEGTSTDILAPSFQTFNDANGTPRTYFGWWIKLKHNGTNGHARVYFEAVPKDPTMQRRVIGPYQFSPQAALHDFSIQVAATPAEVPGSRYKTLTAAWNYLKGVAAKNPLITITEAGTYAMINPGGGWIAGSLANGRCTVMASAPVTLGNPAPAANAGLAPHRPIVEGLTLRGGNITLDFAFASELYKDGVKELWLDGVNLTNSAGRYSLFRTVNRNTLGWLIRGSPWLTECAFSKVWNVASGASLVRGCTFTECWSDAFNGALCTIGNRMDDWDSTAYQDKLDAFSVTYTGAGATATLERTSNTFTARVGSAVVGTYAVNTTTTSFAADANYFVHNVVNWLNSLPGFSATLLDDTRHAQFIAQGSNIPGNFAAVSVKDRTETFTTWVDVHADWWQKQNGPNSENIVVADNLTTGFVGQIVFHGNLDDAIWVNNAWHHKSGGAYDGNVSAGRSQFGNTQRNCAFIHNTIVNQRVWLRTDSAGQFNPDGYCLWANNAVRYVEWQGLPDADLSPVNNHIEAGIAATPTGMTGLTVGGDWTTLYADAANGDFTPAGALTSNKKPPVMKYDLNGAARANNAPVGAVR